MDHPKADVTSYKCPGVWGQGGGGGGGLRGLKHFKFGKELSSLSAN